MEKEPVEWKHHSNNKGKVEEGGGSLQAVISTVPLVEAPTSHFPSPKHIAATDFYSQLLCIHLHPQSSIEIHGAA